MNNLLNLAELIKKRNSLEEDITALIGRPADLGHIGEFIASKVFRITLHESATHKGSDGYFSDGALEGRTVNIKWYARREGLLDINPDALPDYYLVLTGPKAFAVSSRGKTRPWIIENVFLFEAHALVEELKQNGVKIGIAASLQQNLWAKAEIHPLHNNAALQLSEEQHIALALFSSTAGE
jgi:hypothetical protein